MGSAQNPFALGAGMSGSLDLLHGSLDLGSDQFVRMGELLFQVPDRGGGVGAEGAQGAGGFGHDHRPLVPERLDQMREQFPDPVWVAGQGPGCLGSGLVEGGAGEAFEVMCQGLRLGHGESVGP